MQLFPRLSANYQMLRDVTDSVGAEVEPWSYERLDRDAEEQESVRREVAGIECVFTVDRWKRDQNGDLYGVVDCDADLATFLGIKPSYKFIKQRDGRVRY